MNDQEINNKLIIYGNNLKIFFSVLSIITVIGGFIISRNTSAGIDSIFFSIFATYVFYAILVAIMGYVIDLVFNWMAAVLRNLVKNNK